MLRKGSMRITEKHCSYRELCNSRLSWLKLGIVATTSSSMPFSWSLGQMQAGDSTQEWKSIFTSPKSRKWSLIIKTPEYFMLQWLCKLNIVFRDTEIWGLLLLNSKCISLHLTELLFCCHMETRRRANWRQSLVHVSLFVFLPPVTGRKRGKKFSRVGKIWEARWNTSVLYISGIIWGVTVFESERSCLRDQDLAYPGHSKNRRTRTHQWPVLITSIMLFSFTLLQSYTSLHDDANWFMITQSFNADDNSLDNFSFLYTSFKQSQYFKVTVRVSFLTS